MSYISNKNKALKEQLKDETVLYLVRSALELMLRRLEGDKTPRYGDGQLVVQIISKTTGYGFVKLLTTLHIGYL